MNEVRVFDPEGNLKRTISIAELLVRSDEQLKNIITITGARRVIPFTDYRCLRCKETFQSNSTRGAMYCKSCRKVVYRLRKRKVPNK